jgi:hypothetical protein
MGGSSSDCRYTNQGERIDEYRDKINSVLENIRVLKKGPIEDLNNYFNNLTKLYGTNNSTNDYEKKIPIYSYDIKYKGNYITDLTNLNTINNVLTENNVYKFKSFDNIVGLTDVSRLIYDVSNDYEYFFYNGNDNVKGSIQKFFETGFYYKNAIQNQQSDIASLTQKIKEKYGDINLNILNNDKKITDINKVKGDITNKSYSVSFFENLLLQSYLALYEAVKVENHVLINNKNIKTDAYSTDNTKYIYETDKSKYYENINTFLFYFYYLLIIILMFVIFKFNDTNIFFKLTFFPIFAIILILYPLFILKFQNYIHNLFSYIYSYLPPFLGSKVNPSGTLVKPKTNSISGS